MSASPTVRQSSRLRERVISRRLDSSSASNCERTESSSVTRTILSRTFAFRRAPEGVREDRWTGAQGRVARACSLGVFRRGLRERRHRDTGDLPAQVVFDREPDWFVVEVIEGGCVNGDRRARKIKTVAGGIKQRPHVSQPVVVGVTNVALMNARLVAV